MSFVLSTSRPLMVNLSNDLERRESCTHFTGKETEVQKGQRPHPRQHCHGIREGLELGPLER